MPMSEPPPPPFDFCDEQPPDPACFASKRDPDSDQVTLATRIAERMMRELPPQEQAWDWAESTWMFALVDLHRVTGDPAILAYLQAWLDHHIEGGDVVIDAPNRCTPAAIAAELYALTGEERYRRVVEDVLRFLREETLFTEEGGVNHLGVLDILGVTLWVDSLFVFGSAQMRWGELQDDATALADFSEQFHVHTDVLQSEGGLYRHADDRWALDQDPDVYWARGNGWVTAAGYDYLRILRNRGETDDDVADALQRQVDALRDLQDPDTGLWWTVVNRPGETYLETSASALYGYGMLRGYRSGWLDDGVLPVAQAALDGVRERIVEDEQGEPVVTGTSGPTNAGDFDSYAAVAVGDDVPYGVGSTILLLVESAGLLD